MELRPLLLASLFTLIWVQPTLAAEASVETETAPAAESTTAAPEVPTATPAEAVPVPQAAGPQTEASVETPKQVKSPQPQMQPVYREVHYDFYFITGRKGLPEEAIRTYVDELNQELQFQFQKVQAQQGVQVFLHPFTRIVDDPAGLTFEALDVKSQDNPVIVMAQGDAGRAAVKAMTEARFAPLAFFLLDVSNPADFRYGEATALVTSYAGDKSGEMQLLPDPDSKYRNIIFHNHPEVDLVKDVNVRVVVRGNQYTAIVQLANQRENPLRVPPAA